MKLVLKDNRRHILRFDKGEEFFAALTDFLKTNQITAAAFTAIGTCSEIELGYFNSFLKGYRKKLYIENLEIVSLIGNCSMFEGKPVIHAHGSFGKTDFNVVGGHVFKMVVLATCEVFLIKLDGILERKNNPEFNLGLLA
jgi:hypothetical protein